MLCLFLHCHLHWMVLFSSKLMHAMVISALSFTLDGVTLFSSKLMHTLVLVIEVILFNNFVC